MIVGFKINLGNYSMMSVESSEHDKWEDCMKELYNCLRSLSDEAVLDFAKDFFSTHVKEQMKKGMTK